MNAPRARDGRWWYRVAAAAWVVVTSALLLAPGHGTLSVPAWLPAWLPVDLAGHFGLFAGFGFLVHRSSGHLGGSLLAGVVYAGLTEALQVPIPGRSAQLVDLVADGLGLLLGVAVSLALGRWVAVDRGVGAEIAA